MVDIIEISFGDLEDDDAIEENDEMESVEDSGEEESDTNYDSGEEIEGSDSDLIYDDS